MSRAPKHDYAALGIEYDQRRAAGESRDAIKADFESETRKINWGTFWNNKGKPPKTAGTTPKEDNPRHGFLYIYAE